MTKDRKKIKKCMQDRESKNNEYDDDNKKCVVYDDKHNHNKIRTGLINSNVIFVIGGPGAGKGTMCARLARECNYKHLSAGDLLRIEASSGSERGEESSALHIFWLTFATKKKKKKKKGKEIAEIQRQGKLVPSEITVELLRKAIGSLFPHCCVLLFNICRLAPCVEANPDAPGFLIDGFPRNVTQSDMFENGVHQRDNDRFSCFFFIDD
jgi:adenylate kinase family enzyme